ncbi:ComF family protein [Paenibacillus sp. N3/727]|uniref:ComF family protein n=1 Tax=Paenibacillus sp. N3/727 TaxID=2925845 RepID=UPI001F53775A|nr:ComF family protein [Paenibacillus sp. N3/727]UNK18077.1 ComF family protein [Paenibacillus sp. N3/727]
MLMDTLDRFLKPFHRMLAVSGQKCLTCGKTTALSREHLGLCRTCYLSIPWITNPRCMYCGRHIGCPDCTRESTEPWHFVCNRSAAAYNADMREWLAQYKYRGNESYAPLLSGMLERAYRQLQREAQKRWQLFISSHETGKKSGLHWRVHLVTSVPVSETRLKERGFNQAEVLARGLAAACKLPYSELLRRDRHTDKQSYKSRMDRLKDMEGIFGCMPEAGEILDFQANHTYTRSPQRAFQIPTDCAFPIRILLIDDIYTTGSTINACSKQLKAAGEAQGILVEVYSLTWARS